MFVGSMLWSMLNSNLPRSESELFSLLYSEYQGKDVATAKKEFIVMGFQVSEEGEGKLLSLRSKSRSFLLCKQEIDAGIDIVDRVIGQVQFSDFSKKCFWEKDD